MEKEETEQLESLVKTIFNHLGITKNNRIAVLKYLESLEKHDLETYLHSLRVGVLSREAAKYLNQGQRPLYYAGLLHDIGKLDVEKDVLTRTEEFTEQDREKIIIHSQNGHDILSKVHIFTAKIILRHHQYQKNPYPEELPESKHDFIKNNINKIDYYARILAICDFYDALITRNNTFSNGVNAIDDIKSVFREEAPDGYHIILSHKLIDNKILRPLT